MLMLDYNAGYKLYKYIEIQYIDITLYQTKYDKPMTN